MITGAVIALVSAFGGLMVGLVLGVALTNAKTAVEEINK